MYSLAAVAITESDVNAEKTPIIIGALVWSPPTGTGSGGTAILHVVGVGFLFKQNSY